MRYAVNLPNFAEYADPRTVAGLAADAEAAGWDGFFVWDHMVWSRREELPVADPWILLAAVALATERLRLGPMVTPLARRRPAAALDVARQRSTSAVSGRRLHLLSREQVGGRPGRFRYPWRSPGAFRDRKYAPRRRSVGANE